MSPWSTPRTAALSTAPPTGTTAENIILEGSDVVSATPAMTQDETTGEYQYIVSLKLSEAGGRKVCRGHQRAGGQHHLHLDG